MIYGASDEDDWTSEATWYKANPSLGEIIDIEKVRNAYISARENAAEGCLETTEGNDIHYGFIEKFIEELGTKYHIKEIAFDRWGATQMVQDLEGMGFTVVPFGQGYKDMSPPTKKFMKLTLEE